MAASKITSNADFVVEQGASGNWTYRKWKSGLVEAWYSGSISVTTSPIGNIHRAAGLTLAIPSGLFNNTPTFTLANARQKQASWFSCNATADSNIQLGLQIFAASALSSTNVPFSVYIVGS